MASESNMVYHSCAWCGRYSCTGTEYDDERNVVNECPCIAFSNVHTCSFECWDKLLDEQYSEDEQHIFLDSHDHEEYYVPDIEDEYIV